MRQRREDIQSSLNSLVSRVETRGDKNFTAEETRAFDAGLADLRAADARILELEADASRENRSAAARLEAGQVGEQRSTARWSVGAEAQTYRPDSGQSFFKDM